MKREDLISYVRKQRRVIRSAQVVAALFLAGFFLARAGILEKIHPALSADVVIPGLGVATVAVLMAMAVWAFTGMPKCPHCGRMLSMWPAQMAISSGNCGYCGKSIEG